MSSKDISGKLYLKDFSTADKIIRFLLNPDDESIQLTEREKEKWTLLKKVHGYRGQFSTKQQIVSTIIQVHNLKERQAYNLINECEEVFGKVSGVHKDYERTFLLEASRRNIQIAFASRNSKNISYALLSHAKFSGLDDQVVDLPDFSSLEPNQYNIVLPPQVLAVLAKMIEIGSLSLDDFVPPQDINTIGIQEADELPNES